MASFAYVARTQSGEKVDGSVNAPDRRTAQLQLERKGYVPIKVTENGSSAKAAPAKKKAAAAKTPKVKTADDASGKKKFQFERRGPARMKLRETLVFTRDLSNLISSGMTLTSALKTLSRREAEDAQSVIVKALHADITQGTSLSESLSRHPKSFPNFYVNLVKSGEASGRLAESLDELVYYYERTLEAREKVTMAMVYPGIIMAMGFSTVIFCMAFVVPRFESIFKSLGSDLPLPTKMLIGLSDFSVKYGIFVAAGLVILAVAVKRYINTEEGRKAWHGLLLKIPVVSGIIKANAFSNFARTLGSLLGHGVPVLKALRISEQTTGNVVIAEEVAEARSRVTDGATISRPLAQGDVFPMLFTDMLAVGEESGDTAGSLRHISRRYEEDLTRAIKVLTTVMEPLLMFFMAIIVGFIALSILLAVFKMTSGLSVG